MTTASVCDLIGRGIVLQPHEAVAIAQQLIHPPAGVVDAYWRDAPPGPPSIDNVQLREDGTAVAVGCCVRPAVFEIAILLQAMLPAGSLQVPGGLRYAIARGLLDVDAPPFDSVEEFSLVLNRFERGQRQDVVRGVLVRSTGERVVLPFGRPRAVPPLDRRRTSPSTTALHLEQREADRQRYEQRPVALLVPPSQAIAKRTPLRLPAVAAILVGAVAVAGMVDLLLTRAPSPGVSTAPTIASAADVARPAAPIAREPVRPERIPTQAPPPEVRRIRPEPPVAIARTVATEGQLVPALDQQHRPVFSPAFESNGGAMFFHTGGTHESRSALAVLPASPASADGDDLRVMTIVDDGARNYHVQPSPDGRMIAFDSDRDGDRGVYLANRDGTHVRRISGPGYAAVPTWAPDGRRLAYIRAEAGNPKVWNLWLQSLEETEARRLTSFRFGQPWSASWFPDNRRICYTHEDKVIVMDLETGETREFNSPVPGRIVRTPAVSPDGTKVIFQVFRQGAWILDLADGSMRCVLTDPTAEEFAWAPDGHRIAFHSRRDGQWGIFILYQG